MADVPLHSVGGDAEPGGHACRVVAVGQQPQHVELARCEGGEELLSRLPVGHHLPLPGDRLRKQRNGDQHLADGRSTDRFDDLIRGRGLGQVRSRARIDGIEQRRLGLLGAVKHDRGFGDCNPDLAGRDRPARIGQQEVHQHHSGLHLSRKPRGLIAAARDRDHGKVGLALQDPGDRRRQQRVVLHHQHLHLGYRTLIQRDHRGDSASRRRLPMSNALTFDRGSSRR